MRKFKTSHPYLTQSLLPICIKNKMGKQILIPRRVSSWIQGNGRLWNEKMIFSLLLLYVRVFMKNLQGDNYDMFLDILVFFIFI
jgi:hypothetical protein